ncbi:DUF7471 family protein [Natronorarus salvus]|uniref:DUF7471 family protein n=1 Tax=Natronorarus salvus TaxID=3117733 RepID=UPI002F261468
MEGLTSALVGTPIEYLVVVFLETALSLIIVTGVGLLYLRRRSLPYLFVLIAFSTLLVRSALGLASLFDPVALDAGGFTLYNTVEHGLDVVLIGALLVAVYIARGERGGGTP